MDIILVKTNGVSWEEISGYLGCLTYSRRKGIMAKKVERDRINSLLSQLLVLSEIERRTGRTGHKIKFVFGSYGKPYLKDSDFQFSLTHTEGAIAAAFAEGEEIGLDIERKDRRVSDNLCKRVLSEEESFHMTCNNDFLRFWVQKEAFLKRLGVGISRDLRGVNSLELPDTTARDFEEFFLGISGKGAHDAVIKQLELSELLDRFTKLL